MKQILTYSNFNINGTSVPLFTAGQQGLLFTQARLTGLTLVQQAPNSGGTMAMTGDLIGQGMGFGHTLLATGNGDISVTFYGELDEYYRLVNTDQLEVIVGYPVPFSTSGTTSGYTTTAGEVTWLPQGVYSGHSFAIDGNGDVSYS